VRIPINKLDYDKVYILLVLLYVLDSFTTWMLRGLSAKQKPSRLLKISDLIDLKAKKAEAKL